jgi:hypothetical protein
LAAKNLYPDEMIRVTADWVDPTSDACKRILAAAYLGGLHSGVVTAHVELKNALQPNEAPRIVAIIEEQAKLDVRHDTIIRGGWNGLTYLAELIGGDEGQQLIVVRDFLWPDGLAMQQKTYAAEAGAAERCADRLQKNPAMRQTIDNISIGIGPTAKPLGAYVDEYLKVSAQLGGLETERGQLLDGPSEGAIAYQAQLGWIRVVNAMLANGELAQLDAQSEAIIFGPFRLLEKKADERARETLAAAKKKVQEDPSAKGGTGTTGASGGNGTSTASSGGSSSTTSSGSGTTTGSASGTSTATPAGGGSTGTSGGSGGSSGSGSTSGGP